MNKKRTFLVILTAWICAVAFAANTASLYKSNAVASYYADKFHGRKTASGELYDMHAMTAAHKNLPFNTMVKVTNLENGKSVIVRINDRGPFVAGREIDVSKAAATELDMLASGTARVSLEIIETAKEKEKPVAEKASAAETLDVSDVSEEIVIADVDSSKAQRWDIQLGSFSSRVNAENFARKMQKDGIKNLAYQTTKNITRVIIRDITTEDVSAQLAILEEKGITDYLVKERRE